MSCENVFEDSEIIEKNWKRIENDLKKAGLRDGISDGRESNFQNSFDQGFAEGFKNASAIGQYKAAIFLQQKHLGNPVQEGTLLQNPKGGWCQICKTDEILNKSSTEIINQQRQETNKNLEHLHNSYSKYNSDLPRKLE